MKMGRTLLRTPPNDKAVKPDSIRSPHAKPKGFRARAGESPSPDTNEDESAPSRRCILSGEKDARDGLIRLALGPDGMVAPDVRARAPGRGAWIGVNRVALDTANAKGKLKGALARAFKTSAVGAPADLGARIEDALEKDALNRLGLEAKSGMLLTGSEKIDAAARKGEVKLLLHAADAGIDGNRKLDQAWRVGRDREGSAEQGMVLPVGRTILSLALGRENVVHIALTDRAAAERVALALTRWRDFIGSEATAEPCANAAQGPSAREAHDDGEVEDKGFEISR